MPETTFHDPTWSYLLAAICFVSFPVAMLLAVIAVVITVRTIGQRRK